MSIQPSPSWIYSPPGLEPVDINNPLTFLHAAIDNFDQNEETLDEKSTTHAMAMVVYIANGSLEYNIDRTKAKSIDIANIGDNSAIMHYQKTATRPEPHVVKDKLNDILNISNHTASVVMANETDIIWEISPQHDQQKNIPAWGTFNALLLST